MSKDSKSGNVPPQGVGRGRQHRYIFLGDESNGVSNDGAETEDHSSQRQVDTERLINDDNEQNDIVPGSDVVELENGGLSDFEARSVTNGVASLRSASTSRVQNGAMSGSEDGAGITNDQFVDNDNENTDRTALSSGAMNLNNFVREQNIVLSTNVNAVPDGVVPPFDEDGPQNAARPLNNYNFRRITEEISTSGFPGQIGMNRTRPVVHIGSLAYVQNGAISSSEDGAGIANDQFVDNDNENTDRSALSSGVMNLNNFDREQNIALSTNVNAVPDGVVPPFDEDGPQNAARPLNNYNFRRITEEISTSGLPGQISMNRTGPVVHIRSLAYDFRLSEALEVWDWPFPDDG